MNKFDGLKKSTLGFIIALLLLMWAATGIDFYYSVTDLKAQLEDSVTKKEYKALQDYYDRAMTDLIKCRTGRHK